MSQPVPEFIDECLTTIAKAAGTPRPGVAIILGSGLGAFADDLADKVVFPYESLPHFPKSSVPGHAGRLVVGKLDGVSVVAMQGRVHFYEGYAPWQVAFPARVLCAMKPKALVVTNAAGGINARFKVGDLMAITDHVNFAGWNPLVGPNLDSLGPRFPDMTRAYSPALLAKLRAAASAEGITLHEGVYAMMSGPSYETPAEIRMLRTVGADAVGMSTVPEVIAAAHMGVPVAGISCITNMAAGMTSASLSHHEVSEVANRVREVFTRLLRRALIDMGRGS